MSKSKTLADYKNDFSLKALQSSPYEFSVEAAGVARLLTDRAFLKGAEAVIKILNRETDRIVKIIETSRERQSDFDRGISEGAKWLWQAVHGELE